MSGSKFLNWFSSQRWIAYESDEFQRYKDWGNINDGRYPRLCGAYEFRDGSYILCYQDELYMSLSNREYSRKYNGDTLTEGLIDLAEILYNEHVVEDCDE
jgi:hypothetical protein